MSDTDMCVEESEHKARAEIVGNITDVLPSLVEDSEHMDRSEAVGKITTMLAVLVEDEDPAIQEVLLHVNALLGKRKREESEREHRKAISKLVDSASLDAMSNNAFADLKSSVACASLRTVDLKNVLLKVQKEYERDHMCDTHILLGRWYNHCYMHVIRKDGSEEFYKCSDNRKFHSEYERSEFATLNRLYLDELDLKDQTKWCTVKLDM